MKYRGRQLSASHPGRTEEQEEGCQDALVLSGQEEQRARTGLARVLGAVLALVGAVLLLSRRDTPRDHPSLLTPGYQLDFHEVLRVREQNMAKYDYNYSVQGVDRRSGLSVDEFSDVYDGKWPVLITDVVPSWPAFNWTPQFLLTHYGDQRVVMKAVNKALDARIALTLRRNSFDLSDLGIEALDFLSPEGGLGRAVSLALPLRLFHQHIEDGAPDRWTYVEDELFIPSRPQLHSQIDKSVYQQPDLFELFPVEVRPWGAMLLWGTAYSRSSLHIDPYNWTGTNAVLSGRKRWKMFPPGQDHYLDVMSDKRSGFPLDCYKYNSVLDAFAEDAPSTLRRAEVLEFDQLPGELLVIPPGWFHQAFNVEETLAVSGQIMNANNIRVVLEEVLKGDSVKRDELPVDIDELAPETQVRAVMDLLPQQVLERGEAVTRNMKHQVNTKKSLQ